MLRPAPQPAPSLRQQALACEAARDLPGALEAWQQALTAEPDSLDIARHLADLAFRLNMWDMAEKLLAHLINRGIRDMATLTAFAATLREQSLFDDAIDLLKTLLAQNPQETALWEGLGAVMAAKGDVANAVIFFDEALRLDPGNLHALFNRACALMDRGDMRSGLRDSLVCADAFRDPDNRRSAEMACAHASLALGDLKAGWRWFQARHKAGSNAEVHYDLNLPRLDPGENLAAKRLLVSAEQGLGDEILFASLLPDIAAAIGDYGWLGIVVEPRLVPLFARSFPQARVMAHRTRTLDGRIVRDVPGLDPAAFDSYVLIGDLLSRFRPDTAAFSPARAFLTPPSPPLEVQAWLGSLAPGPRVGILWKSLKSNAARDRYFAPFSQWMEVMAVPGITFVNLQYGDVGTEQAMMAAAGLTLHTAPGLDLKDDLDGLAGLCAGLDVVLGPSNATTNIAAACGVPTWLLGLDHAWLKLGQDDYPWYPNVRYICAPAAGHWQPAMDLVRDQLSELTQAFALTKS